MKSFYLWFISTACLCITEASAAVNPLPKDSIRNTDKFAGISAAPVSSLGKPDNFYWKRVHQNAENHGGIATFLNGQYVSSLLGFDKVEMQRSAQASLFYMQDSLPERYADSIVIGRNGASLYYVNGRPFSYIQNYVCPNYRPKIARLPQTWLLYAPERAGWSTTVFLFNDFLLTRGDLHEFCYDSDYVAVEACTSRGFLWGQEDLAPASPDYWTGNVFVLRMYDPNYAARLQKSIKFVDKTDGDSLLWFPYREEKEEVEVVVNKQKVGSLQGVDAAYLAASPSCRVSIERDGTGRTIMNLYDSSYRPEWMTLEAILNRFYPSLGDMRERQRYLVFLNGRPLAGRQKNMYIDGKYIHTVRVYDEKNLYVVVSIYTKTPKDVREENTPVRIR